MIGKFSAAAAVLSFALPAALAGPVKPLSVALGQTCVVANPNDCAGNAVYCKQTPQQRKKNAPTGICAAKKPAGSVCYTDNGCLSGSCNGSVCGAPAPTGPQLSCAKVPSKTLYLGQIDSDMYTAQGTKATKQPYLTFDNHYDANSHEVLTTAGASKRIPAEFWACESTAMNYATAQGYIYGQIRLPTRGGACLSVSQDDPGNTIGYWNSDLPKSTVYYTACNTTDTVESVQKQFFVASPGFYNGLPGGVVGQLGRRGGFALGANAQPFNNVSSPFVLPVVPKPKQGGAYDPSVGLGLGGTTFTANDGSYSTWLLDYSAQDAFYGKSVPLYLVSGYTRGTSTPTP